MIRVAVLLLLLGGCSAFDGEGLRDRVATPLGPVPVEVTTVTERGDYLDVVLHSESFHQRLFFANAGACRDMLHEGATVTFHRTGRHGRLTREKVECDPIGTGALAQIRASRPRRPGLRGLPRELATFRIVYSDDEVAFARGRFVLAGLLEWVRAQDTIAVIARTPECKAALERGYATTEYRDVGTHPLLLISDGGYCPIEGLIAPLPLP